MVGPDVGEGSRRECLFLLATGADEQFFPRHFPGQRPEILWIGCTSFSTGNEGS
jgi:hypothetical protein